jgi:hypothetical protein
MQGRDSNNIKLEDISYVQIKRELDKTMLTTLNLVGRVCMGFGVREM